MKNMLFMCFWGRVKLPSNEVQYRIWEKKESKYAKTPAWIQVTAIFLMQDIRTNFLPHLKRFVWRRHAGRKPTETSVTEFATKAWENHKHYNSTFSNTVQIANFHEVHHLFNKHYSSLGRQFKRSLSQNQEPIVRAIFLSLSSMSFQ